ncbi:tail tape measure protein [Enterococcus wangshanyuanii]|uniref:Tail tape measure protein n=3 Tax=Enterococcus TaxID=1350 RepID=A0ABQ1PVG2_9ENTE|nr:tail tape measure protein [Enterococcus wangshanyuanii]
MNNEDLVLKMILDESGFASGLNAAVKKLGDFDGKVDNTSQKGGRSLGSIWTSFVGNFLASGASKIISKGIGLITSNLDGAINRVDTLNNANRVFENMGFSAGETSKTMDSLKKSIQGLPTPLDGAIKGVQLIASSTNDLGKSEKIFAALNNGILGFGGSAEMVDNAVVQLSQSFSNGKVDAQTWNSMINSGLGPALNALAKQMGLTAGEMKEGLSNGTISVEEFQDSLIKLNKEGGGGLKSLEQIAKDSTAGIKTGIANMKTAIVRGVANLITKFDEALQDAGFGSISEIIAEKGAALEKMLTNFANALPGIIKTAKQLYDTLKPYEPVLVALAASIGTLMVINKVNNAMKAWKKATEAMTIVQAILNSTMLANPIVAITTLIVGLVAGIVYLWKTNEGFRNAIKDIWKGITDAISSAADAVVKAWDATIQWFSDMWKGLQDAAKSAADGIKNAWSTITGWFSNQFQEIQDATVGIWNGAVDGAKSGVNSIKEAWSGVKQWFADLWKSITSTASGLVDGIMQYIGPLVYGVRNAFMHMGLFLSNLWKNLVNIAKNIFTILKNVIMAPMLFVTSLISDGWDEAKNNMIAVWENIAEAAGNIWGSITDIISNFLLNIKMAGLNIWYGIKNSFLNIWNELSSRAVEIWDNVKTYFSDLWTGMKENAAQSWTDLKVSVATTWENLKQGAADTAKSIGTFFVEGWASLKENTAQTWENIKKGTVDGWEAIKKFFSDTVNNMVEGAKNAWENLKKSVRDTVEKIANIFSDLKKIDLYEIGKNIVQGLINGVNEMIGKVGKTIKGVAGTIKNTIKKNLGINSPSRWMRDMIGKNIVLGVVRGVEQEQSTLDNTVKKMTDFPVELPSISAQSKVPTINSTDKIDQKNRSDSKAATDVAGDTFNINLQALGEMSESQLMGMARQLVKYIEMVRNNDTAPQGGAYNGA